MNSTDGSPRLRLSLDLDAAAERRLQRLQEAFSRGCNFLAATARENRCWSRVALHHLGYKALRETMPELGAQMTCNAVYAVCRACLAVYMNPSQPWGPRVRNPLPLPVIAFSTRAPVYLDRHTLTIREGDVSIFTLEGRMHCRLPMEEKTWQRLRSEHLVQTLLLATESGFALEFQFDVGLPALARNRPRAIAQAEAALQAHLKIEASPLASLSAQRPQQPSSPSESPASPV